jgi:hypothetical protein
MARQHGYKGEVAIDPLGTTTYAPVASLNNWTLDTTRDRVDVTCFGDAQKQYVQGLSDLKGTFAGIWDPLTTPSEIFAIAMGDVAVGLKLTPSTLTATTFFSGLAYLDASIAVAVTGAITISGSFASAGDWALTSA